MLLNPEQSDQRIVSTIMLNLVTSEDPHNSNKVFLRELLTKV
jgi:hypothetical protein